MNTKMKVLASALALAVGVAGCSQTTETTATTAVEQSVVLTSGIDKANFDSSVRIQDDFYNAINGVWLKNTPIPADRSNYGAFSALYDNSQIALRNIIEEAAKEHAAPGSDAQKIGDFYSAYMNEALIDSLGYEPIKPMLAKIAGVSDKVEMAGLMGELLTSSSTIPFGFYVNNDAKKSDQYAVYLYQGGLGLPDRDFYLNDSEKFVKIRAAYVAFMTDMLTLVGDQDAAKKAEQILALETEIATLQWSRVESRNASKTYNKMSITEVDKLMGDFNWWAFAKTTGLQDVSSMIVRQPSYLEGFGKLFAKTDLETWKTYLSMKLVADSAPYLSKAFGDRSFEFYGKTLRGVEQQKPRWKKAVDNIDGVLGELAGKLYVAENFKPEAKQRMEVLVANLIKAYEASIKELDWMGEETRQRALDKLAAFTPKIGYPDEWQDYSDLEIKPDDLVGNMRRASLFQYKQMLDKLGGPIDRGEWHMTPQTVNAYYNPVMNEIVFPAAILQPPFFDLNADDAVNYGGIGAVIGHEIGHGFDDQGSKYDGTGNLNNWWTDADRKAFEKRTAKLVEQYSQYAPFPDAHVNGRFTLGENIGDLGGLSIAYRAYQLSLEGKDAPVIDELTGNQRFFMGWAQVWRRNYREEELRNRLITDPHSPSQYRANGIVSNIPAFYATFDVKEGDKMYIAPENRVKIW